MTWTESLAALCRSGSVSAAEFLTLMEPETDDALDQAFAYLAENRICVDLSDLPAVADAGASAVRLRREAALAKEGALLTALEENDPLRLYLEEVAATKTEDDPQHLAQKCAAGDESAPEKLVNAMLGSVVDIAREFTGRGVLLLDLCQEGGLALWQAILSYETGDFTSLCLAQIRQAMAMAVLNQARSCGIGQRLRQGMEDYRDVDQQLLAELGRNPTVEELAERLHISQEEVLTIRGSLQNAQLRRQVDEARAPKEEPDPDDQQAVENTAYFQSRQRIEELLSSLSQEDAKLISLRFGLEGGLPLTPEQTGEKLGLTPEEVLDRERAALAALRGE